METQSFRDKIATVDKKGKRIWVFPKKPFGPLYKYRKWVSYLLLALMFSGPFIRINGSPLLLLDIIDRKFIFFGQIFWPQDFYLFVLGFIASILGILLFTLIFGRLFCGWVCPQTIFMEMVFRRIEYWIDGDFAHQKKLAKMPWNGLKVRKRLLKHSIFYLISFLISNIFLAYIIGSERLFELATDGPVAHAGSFVAILVFSGVFYAVFAWFREQVCTVVCPYGRLQGVLLDRKSIVVAYDHVRGEERAKFKKGEDRAELGKGDCIDCHQCVHVCPTGIDIRNGTQLECVNCTACIDACNYMMEKVGLEKGLIRYASESEIAENKPFKLSTKAYASMAALLVILGFLVALLFTRSDVSTTLLRIRGKLYEKYGEDHIANIYQFQVRNKTMQSLPITFKLENLQGEIKLAGPPIELEQQTDAQGIFQIIMAREDISKLEQPVKVGIYGGGKRMQVLTTTFIGPPNKNQ